MDLDATLPAARADSTDRDEPVAKVADLRVLAVELAESLVQVSEQIADALVSPIHRRVAPEH